jgi:hypothetical protein
MTKAEYLRSYKPTSDVDFTLQNIQVILVFMERSAVTATGRYSGLCNG